MENAPQMVMERPGKPAEMFCTKPVKWKASAAVAAVGVKLQQGNVFCRRNTLCVMLMLLLCSADQT